MGGDVRRLCLVCGLSKYRWHILFFCFPSMIFIIGGGCYFFLSSFFPSCSFVSSWFRWFPTTINSNIVVYIYSNLLYCSILFCSVLCWFRFVFVLIFISSFSPAIFFVVVVVVFCSFFILFWFDLCFFSLLCYLFQ